MSKTSELLKQDLAALGMTQKEFADRLTKLCEAPISQQAVSLWCHRDYIPPRRRPAVIEVLGPNAMLPRTFTERIFGPDAVITHHRADEPAERLPMYVRVNREILRVIPGAHPERVLRVGDYRRSFDYVSERIVVSFLEGAHHPRQPFHPFMIARRVLNLALARKFNTSTDCVLILIGDTESDQIDEIKFECDAFGVELLAFPDLESGVAYIAERESLDSLPPADLDDSYS